MGVRHGGRQPGTPNKKADALREKCIDLGVDPFEILLLFAKGDWKTLGYDSSSRVKAVTENGEEILEDVISAELRAQCAKEACQYVHPKRKALELSNEDERGFKIVVEDYTSK